MAWLTAHAPRLFPMRQWRRVLFTDESRFTLYCADGRRRVYRLRGERFADACVVKRDRFGGGSIMVWGGIALGIKSQLIIVSGNMTAEKTNLDVSCESSADDSHEKSRLVFSEK